MCCVEPNSPGLQRATSVSATNRSPCLLKLQHQGCRSCSRPRRRSLPAGQDDRRGDRGDADLPVGRLPEDRAVVGRRRPPRRRCRSRRTSAAAELHGHDRRVGHRPAACGLGLFQITLPVWQSTATSSASPPGARIARIVLDQRALAGVPRRHVAPNWRTRSISQ